MKKKKIPKKNRKDKVKKIIVFQLVIFHQYMHVVKEFYNTNYI